MAAVVVAYGGSHPGFVLAGRSLREVEIREGQIEQIIGIAMLVTLVGSLFVVVMCELILPEKQHIG